MKTMKPLVVALAVLLMPCGLFAQGTTTTVSTTETKGTISEVKPDTIVVRTESSSTPTSYSYSKSTTYVDETGKPVSMETVKSGLPVTVYYTREGERMVATKLVVKKTTTTTEMPPIETKKTTTTTTETK